MSSRLPYAPLQPMRRSTALLLVLLFAALTLASPSAGPAHAADGYEPDPEVVDDVRSYAAETEHGFAHVWRWVRVLESFGALEGMTVAEAEDNADRFMASRWDPVADELRRLEDADGETEADQQLIADIRGYAEQTEHGFEHVWRWVRALKSLGAVEAMTAAEARDNAGTFMASRWDPVAAELAEMEASTAEPEPTPAPEPTPEPTPAPNRAPQVDTAAANYAGFVAAGNAPRGILVTKRFAGVFSDPDGDQLTYSLSDVDGPFRLVDQLGIFPEGSSDASAAQSSRPLNAVMRVYFRADDDDDWDAMVPPVPEQPLVTVTLTATDPDGLTASVQGSFLIHWEPQPQEPDCELTAPSSVAGLGAERAAVITWSLPEDLDDTCNVTGFVVGATSALASYETRVADPEARRYVMLGIEPGDYHFYVRIEYSEGTSDELVTMQQNVPSTCSVTLTVAEYAGALISGRWSNEAGMGCVNGPEIEFHFKRTQDDYYMEYGRFPNWPQSDPDLPSFIIGGLDPYVSYDFKIVAVDAAGQKHDSNVASATIVTNDASVTPDANSPRDLRILADNNGAAYVSWSSPASFGAGRTFSAYVIEWKDEDGATETELITSSAGGTHRIAGLTDGTAYTIRMAARTTDAQSNTHDAWSATAPTFIALSEPTKLWFDHRTPLHNSGRLFMSTGYNKGDAAAVCTVVSDDGTETINCPHGTLVNLDADGDITVSYVHELNGVETPSHTSEGVAGGPGAPPIWASGGNGELVVEWGDASISGIVGNLDRFIIQHREGTSGAWTDTVVTDTDARKHTVSVTTTNNSTPTDWQVRIRARSDGDDGDANTTDTARLGFTSEILTVKTHILYTLTPRLPNRVRVKPGESQSLVVEWEHPEQDDRSRVYAYQVRHRLRGEVSWTESAELHPRLTHRICGSAGECENPRRLEITGLTGGNRYEVAVRAKNANGWSEWLHTRSHNIPND